MTGERSTPLSLEELAALEDAWREMVTPDSSTKKPDSEAAAALLLRHTGNMLAEIRRVRAGATELAEHHESVAANAVLRGAPPAVAVPLRAAMRDLLALVAPYGQTGTPAPSDDEPWQAWQAWHCPRCGNRIVHVSMAAIEAGQEDILLACACGWAGEYHLSLGQDPQEVLQ